MLHLGLISKAFPEAQILMTNRNPMDNGMALFKQPYFPFSYDLNELARYFVAYSKLQNHWQALVPNLYVQNYETLVREPRKGIEALLQHCNLPFEDTCFHFYNHSASSTSASAAQVREKPHTRSVGKWKRWTQELAPLQTHLDLNHIQYDQ